MICISSNTKNFAHVVGFCRVVAKSQSRGSISEIVWDFKPAYLHSTILNFWKLSVWILMQNFWTFWIKHLQTVASLLARAAIITSVGKVWGCKETDAQEIKTWLLRDTCSTELCNYRNVSGVRPVNDLSVMQWGLEHLVWDLQFTVKLLSSLLWAHQWLRAVR